jgi:DNA-binding MarR family transcriptional regulator
VLEREFTLDETNEQLPKMDPLLQRALSHPRRMAMLGYLMQKRDAGTGEAELADALDLSLAKVKYHLLVLCEADLIAHVEDRESTAAERYIAAAAAGA